MDTRGGGPMKPNRRLGTILGALGVAALSLNFFISLNHAFRYPDGLKVLEWPWSS